MTEAEWRTSLDGRAMMAVVKGKGSDRLWRLFAVAGLRHEEHEMRDSRSRHALDVAERFADGAATAEEFIAARIDSEAAAHQAHADEWEDEARAKFRMDAQYAAMLQAMFAADAALISLSEDIETTCTTQERLWIPDLLREVFGNPFRWFVIDPAWLRWHDGFIPQVAQTIYDQRRFGDLPILGDALEDAGCTDMELLEHCHRPGEHVRGCWVVDLLLGKA